MRAGRYVEAFQLLAPLEDQLAGDLRYDYLLEKTDVSINLRKDF